MQTINGRIPPALPAAAYRTFAMAAPLATHWRRATCAEVQCDAYLRGWRTIVPGDSAAASYIRADRSRRHVEELQPGGLVCFTFGPGQQGFASRVAAEDHSAHRIRLDREAIFLERGGDWRGNPLGERRVHRRPDDWVDSFATHQDRLATLLRRG